MFRRSAAVAGLVGAFLFAPFVSGLGLTESGSSYIVDTSGGLVFTVDSISGDITSLKYKGVEAQGSGRHSHIASGLWDVSCTNKRTGNGNNYIVITCTTPTLVHYYIARYKTPAIWMATYTTAEPSVGELRYIARLKSSVITTGPAGSKIGGDIIEGADVFRANGTTRSKFYSGVQFINDQVHGAAGPGIGAYMVIPGTGYEGSSGGPFFKDINNQHGTNNEVYFYMNSGHAQTEPWRQGLHGPYALWFTNGPAPASNPDTSFFDGLGVQGYVPKSGRGRVIGKAVGISTKYHEKITIGWSNTDAQYWTKADANTLHFSSPYMKPGKYIMSLYKGELVVGTANVTVDAGKVVSSNARSTFALDSLTPIWTIGDFDGTPTGFLNANLIADMHPSDSRMSKWGPITYTVGSPIVQFPMAIFRAIGPLTIKTTLNSSQIGARTLRIGTTLAFAGGRPTVVVNSWTPRKSPAAPNQPDSRGVTRGTYRGNNILYEWTIPEGVLVAGPNTITISIISGSGGEGFLSPNVVLDAVALY